MKRIYQYIGAVALVAFTAACSEDTPTVGGEGNLMLSTSVNSDVEVVSRATEQELADGCMVWISNEKGLVRRYEGLSTLPASIPLLSGRYVAEAWTGDSVSASFDKRWFKGREEFNLEGGATTRINLVCKIANVVASVNFADNMDDLITDYTLTVGHARGSLTFEGRDTRKGYFMMPSTDKNLSYELAGTQMDGKPFSFKGVIENARPATEYVLNVTCSERPNNMGGAIFTITIDSHEIEVSNETTIIAPPKFSGYGFSLVDPMMGEQGSFGRRTVYIASAAEITNVEVNSPYLKQVIPGVGEGIDLLEMSTEGQASVNAAGITFSRTYNAETNQTLVQVNFEPEFTDRLTNGEYNFELVATDAQGRTATANLHFIVSDAPVQTLPIEPATVGMRGVELRGQVSKDGVESVGFNYRPTGSTEWQHVEGHAVSRSFAKGDIFVATLTDLTPNTTYEYAATNDNYVSNFIETVTTLNGPQLPNSSFEDWQDSKAPYLIYASGDQMFWDSGNHGSATMRKNVTVPDTSVKHSGSRSVKLASQFVGIGSLGKFAAGNLFAGQYLATLGTNGALGWGRSFDLSEMPKAVKLWVKYSPVAITDVGAGAPAEAAKGNMDNGIIYVALTDDTPTGKKTYKEDNNNVTTPAEEWAVVIRTSDDESKRQLFNKDEDPNVVAYGERIFTSATDGMIEVTIPLEYKKSGVTPTRIIFVASASRYGDFFTGGNGSTMWLDDVELVY